MAAEVTSTAWRGPAQGAYVGPPPRAPAAAARAALAAFEPTARKRLGRMMRTSRREADLLTSFPAAAYLIATGERGPETTGRVVRLVREGAPLTEVAALLELPRWSRRLPASAFRGAVGRLDFGAEFNRAVAAVTPSGDADAAMWLRWVTEAERLCGPDFALWVAKQRVFAGDPVDMAALGPLAAYVWVSMTAPLGCRSRFADALTKRWSPRMGFDTAANRTVDWISRLLNRHCASREDSSGWQTTQRLGGYAFVPLTTAAELTAEGEAMINCLATYAREVAAGDCLIFAVRRGRKSVASVEICAGAAPGEARVAQLEGPRNQPAAERVRRAVDKWLDKIGPCPLRRRGVMRTGRFDGARWANAAAPYVAARPAAAAYWSRTGPEALQDVEAALRALKTAQRNHARAS